jgi:hypothetical protein
VIIPDVEVPPPDVGALEPPPQADKNMQQAKIGKLRNVFSLLMYIMSSPCMKMVCRGSTGI